MKVRKIRKKGTRMSDVMDAQHEGRFENMSERDKEIQASIWGLIFLLSEISLAFRVLRDRLMERGALEPEDEELINTLASNEDHLRGAYAHIENAFREKYTRVRTALDHPDEVTRIMEEELGKKGDD